MLLRYERRTKKMPVHRCHANHAVQVFPLAGQLHASWWVQFHTTQLGLLAANVLFWLPVWKHYMSSGAPPSATRRATKQGQSSSLKHVLGALSVTKSYTSALGAKTGNPTVRCA